jgi:hypothetical protein
MEYYLAQLLEQQNRYFRVNNKDTYDAYTEPELESLALLCSQEENWKVDLLQPYYQVNILAGQVRVKPADGTYRGTWRLIGDTSVRARIKTVDGYVQRSHFILRNSVGAQPQGQTADHKNNRRPFDDSGDNLQWATFKQQANNRRLYKRCYAAREVQASTTKDFSTIDAVFSSTLDVISKTQMPKGTLLCALSTFQRAHGLFWRYTPVELDAEEVWKDLTYFGDKKLKKGYQVSSLGRFSRNGRTTDGHKLTDTDYLLVSLTTAAGAKIKARAHIVVCTVFHGLCPEPGNTVDHKDRNPLNNRASNLRWADGQKQILNRNLSSPYFRKNR